MSELELAAPSSPASSALAADDALLAASRWALWSPIARGVGHSLANAAQLLALEPCSATARGEARDRLGLAIARLAALQGPSDGTPALLPDVLAELDACQEAQLGLAATRLVHEPGAGLAALAIAPADLLHALLALVTNAKEAAGVRRATIRLQASRDARGVTLVVRDDGPGFADDARRCAFAPGVVRRDATHLGLGLWAARTLLRRAGGEALLGEGASVLLRLPAWRRRRAR